MKKPSPTLTPFYVDPGQIRGLRNMKPNTYPAVPINPEDMVSKALIAEIPRKLFEGDWLVDLDNDITFLEQHFQCSVGDYLWIRETHRLTIKTDPTDPTFKEVHVEYLDGDKRKTDLLPEEVNFDDGRKIPPIAMKKLACRFVLKVREIGVQWADTDKRTRLIWVVGIERMPDAEYLLEQERRGVLK